MTAHFGTNRFRRDFLPVLCSNQNRCNANGPVPIILNSHLCLSIWQQKRQFICTPHEFQPPGKFMCQFNRQRHKAGSLIAGVAEHHALVSRPGVQLLVFPTSGDPPCNIRGLLMQIHMDDACIRVKAPSRPGIADPRNDLPRYGGVVDFRPRRHFTKNVQLVFCTGHFAGNTRIRGSHQQLIQNLICHLIANLVRMAAGHRF